MNNTIKLFSKTSITLFLSFLLVAVIVLPVHADGWVDKEVAGAQTVKGITKAGSNMIVAGNSGKIFYSSDSGDSWQEPVQIMSNWLNKVITIEDTNVFAVGDQGVMVTSSDQGASWAPVTSIITSYNLKDVEFVSSTHGVAVGEYGTILQSSNGGASWIASTSNITKDIYGVGYQTSLLVWATREDGVLSRSIDGGITWFEKTTSNTKQTNDIEFIDSTTGFFVGVEGVIYRTTDSAVTWEPLEISGLGVEDLYSIETRDDGQVLIVGEGIVLYSADSGETWSVENFEGESLYGAYISGSERWVSGTNDGVVPILKVYEEVIVEEEADPVSDLDEEVVEDDVVDEIMAEATVDNLIKTECPVDADATHYCRAVYYYSSQGTRHAFPNEKVFFTWYDNFDSVVTVSSNFMSSLQLSKNVTYHPGTKMVKFQTINTVYAVSAGGVLRAVDSEQTATDLYGSDWNKQIDDIPDVFYGNYTFGDQITGLADYNVQSELDSVISIDASL